MVTDGEFARDIDRDIEEHADHLVPALMTRMKQADERVVSLVRDRPIAMLCAAVAVGYVIGRVFNRF